MLIKVMLIKLSLYIRQHVPVSCNRFHLAQLLETSVNSSVSIRSILHYYVQIINRPTGYSFAHYLVSYIATITEVWARGLI